MKKIILFLCSFSLLFMQVLAIGRGEKKYLFKNKVTGEYKNTYQKLYRGDYDDFRDSLEKYIKDTELPNTTSFQKWDVVAYKICDREVCTYKGNKDLFQEHSSIITIDDFSESDKTKIYENQRHIFGLYMSDRNNTILGILGGLFLILFILIYIFWKIIWGIQK